MKLCVLVQLLCCCVVFVQDRQVHQIVPCQQAMSGGCRVLVAAGRCFLEQAHVLCLHQDIFFCTKAAAAPICVGIRHMQLCSLPCLSIYDLMPGLS
jgi:hypothetical protein